MPLNVDRIDAIIEDVIRTEGGYVNDPADRGGETKYGITVAAARRAGYTGPMRDLPIALARQIYRQRYVTEPAFDQVAQIDADVGAELIDTGVNMGPAIAAVFLQRWLNGLNSEGRYDDLFVDGRVGPVTLGALRALLAWRGRDGRRVLLRGLNGVQGARYLEIVESRRDQRRFLYGWMLQRVVMEV